MPECLQGTVSGVLGPRGTGETHRSGLELGGAAGLILHTRPCVLTTNSIRATCCKEDTVLRGFTTEPHRHAEDG